MNVPDEETPTERGRERRREEERYLPVIVKRSDETLRHPDDVLDRKAGVGRLLDAVRTGALAPSWDAARFLTVALGGNLLGGSFFVAILDYGHIRQSQVDAGRPLRDAVAFGVAAGAAAVMQEGTALCRRGDTDRLYEHARRGPGGR